LSQTKETKEPKDAKGGKPRVYVLANELDLDTKTVLEFCKELGYGSIKNQLSALEPEQAEAVRERARKGGPRAAAAPAAPARPVVPPKLDKIPTLTKPKTLTPARPAPAPAAPAVEAEAVPHGPVVAPACPGTGRRADPAAGPGHRGYRSRTAGTGC
jgi:translation initiation factor IF-2